VRIQPDHVSFNTVSAWKDIYGFHSGQETFIKTEFYESASTAPKGTNPSILLDTNIERHGRTRRLLSHAFSSKALLEQEWVVRELIQQLLTKFELLGTDEKGMVVTDWFSYLTFDTLGKLSLGEPFGCLDKGEPHYWVKHVLENFKAAVILAFLSRHPFVLQIFRSIAFRAKRTAVVRQLEYLRERSSFGFDRGRHSPILCLRYWLGVILKRLRMKILGITPPL